MAQNFIYISIYQHQFVVTVSSVLVSHSSLQALVGEHTPQTTTNPFKLIARVLHYARKHKYPENRSALTYWEEKVPSRLDLGKEKYGGPFTEEEVEDVKTVFRMLPLFIPIAGFTCTDEAYYWMLTGSIKTHLSYLACYVSTEMLTFVTSCILFFIYLLIIRVWIHKYIPNTLFRSAIGLILASAAMLTKMTILLVYPYHSPHNNDTPYTNNFLFVAQVFEGMSFTFVIPATLEFTVAQTPIHMRGVMVGLWLASMGLGYAVNIITKIPFGCRNVFLCTSPYYYLAKSVIVILVFMAFVILAKRYKFRVRENEVNIHQIVDDHYQRYMEQEDVKELELSDD